MRLAIAYTTIIVALSYVHSSERYMSYKKIGSSEGLGFEGTNEYVFTPLAKLEKPPEIAPSDQKKQFLNHTTTKVVAIMSQKFDYQTNVSIHLFWKNLQDPSISERKEMIMRGFAEPIGCWKNELMNTIVGFIKKLIKGKEKYLYVSKYSYSVAGVFEKPLSKLPILLAIKMRKLGEIFLGLLYNIDIFNSSEKGSMDLPMLRKIDVKDIGLKDFDKTRKNSNYRALNVVFRYSSVVSVFDVSVYKNMIEPFKIFKDIQNPTPEKIKTLNYLQLYYFWFTQMKNYFSYLKFDYPKCFLKRFSSNPFLKVSCPTVFTMMLEKLDENEFKLLKDLSSFIFDFNEEVFKTALFKIFTLMINMKAIFERNYDFKNLEYNNPKKAIAIPNEDVDAAQKLFPANHEDKEFGDEQERVVAVEDEFNGVQPVDGNVLELANQRI